MAGEDRQLASQLGDELDLTKVVWLEGRIAAGLGSVAAPGSLHSPRCETGYTTARIRVGVDVPALRVKRWSRSLSSSSSSTGTLR